MSKFKVGDKVRLKDSEQRYAHLHNLTGDLVVKAVGEMGVVNFEGHYVGAYEDRLEHVKEEGKVINKFQKANCKFVKCVNGSGWGNFGTGEIYEVLEIADRAITVRLKNGSPYKILNFFDDFEPYEDISKHHKHHDLIIAWAKGAEIECKDSYGEWVPCQRPEWLQWCEYRVKPQKTEKELLIEETRGKIEELQEQLDKLEKL